METLFQDIRFGLRMLIKNPSFTIVAILTLALGIGANTAIFSIVNAVLLRPLPFAKADQLMVLNESSPQRDLLQNPVSAANYLDWRAQSKSFSDMALLSFGAFTYSTDAGAIRINAGLVSTNLFQMLGVKPMLGRDFIASESELGHDDVVILSEQLWQRQFGGNAKIIGQTVKMNSHTYTVIGVMPKNANFPFGGFELWKPLSLTPEVLQNRAARQFGVMARLKDNVDISTARVEMTTIATRLSQSYPNSNANWSVDIQPLTEQTVSGVKTALLTLLASVIGVLLIACVNVAALLSARLAARQREIGLRIALGATRLRLMRQLLTESIILSLIGGIGGILLAYWGLEVLLQLIPAGIPRIEEVRIDYNVLAFTFLSSIVTGLIFGFAPAWHTTGTNINAILKEGSLSSTGSRARNRFQATLVVSEVVLSLVLLISAGLLIRSFISLRNTDPGFKTDGVFVNTLLVLPTTKYPENPQRVAFFQHLMERIERLPGVESVGGITALPLQGNSQFSTFRINGRPQAPGQDLSAVFNTVSPNYFNTMSIPLKQGRAFDTRDNSDGKPVVIINEALAARDFANQNPIGQQIYLDDKDTPYEIVGVVGDCRQFGLGQPPAAEVFTNYLQHELSFMYVLVRARGDLAAFAPPIRNEVRDLDPDQPVGYRTLNQQFDNALAGPRFITMLLGIFAAIAFLLAMIGLYGVISYSVSQRTHEIGVRIALGAQAGDLLKMIVGQGMKLALIGIVIGLVGAFVVTRLLVTLLYGVTATDPITYLSVTGSLLLVALLAIVVPARRATRVDPMVALRYE